MVVVVCLGVVGSFVESFVLIWWVLFSLISCLLFMVLIGWWLLVMISMLVVKVMGLNMVRDVGSVMMRLRVC